MDSKEDQWFEAMRAEQTEPAQELVNRARYKAKTSKAPFLASDEDPLVALILGLNVLLFIIVGVVVMKCWVLPPYRLMFMIIVLGLSYLPCFIYLIAKEGLSPTQINKEGF